MKVVLLDNKRMVREQVEADELEIAIAYAKECKEKLTKAQAMSATAEAEVLRLLEERGQKTAISHFNGGLQATAVYGERLKVNEKALQKAVGATVWNSITVRKLDRAKLEDAIAAEKVDPHTVATCSTMEPNKPYVRITEHKQTDEADEDV